MHNTALQTDQQAFAALRMRGALQADRVTVAPEDLWLPQQIGPVPVQNWDKPETSLFIRVLRVSGLGLLAAASFLLVFCLPY
jgi:hypothetical protein